MANDELSKTGQERLADIVKDDRNMTLDEILDRDPKQRPVSDEELLALVPVLREERTHIEVKAERRKEKRKNDE